MQQNIYIFYKKIYRAGGLLVIAALTKVSEPFLIQVYFFKHFVYSTAKKIHQVPYYKKNNELAEVAHKMAVRKDRTKGIVWPGCQEQQGKCYKTICLPPRRVNNNGRKEIQKTNNACYYAYLSVRLFHDVASLSKNP